MNVISHPKITNCKFPKKKDKDESLHPTAAPTRCHLHPTAASTRCHLHPTAASTRCYLHPTAASTRC